MTTPSNTQGNTPPIQPDAPLGEILQEVFSSWCAHNDTDQTFIHILQRAQAKLDASHQQALERERLEARLVELDLLEQAINTRRMTTIASRMADLEARLSTLTNKDKDNG